MISSFWTCHLRSPIQSLGNALARIHPGRITLPPTSSTGIPSGSFSIVPTSLNLPLSTRIVPLPISPLLTVNRCAFVIAKTSSSEVMFPLTEPNGPTVRGRSPVTLLVFHTQALRPRKHALHDLPSNPKNGHPGVLNRHLCLLLCYPHDHRASWP